MITPGIKLKGSIIRSAFASTFLLLFISLTIQTSTKLYSMRFIIILIYVESSNIQHSSGVYLLFCSCISLFVCHNSYTHKLKKKNKDKLTFCQSPENIINVMTSFSRGQIMIDSNFTSILLSIILSYYSL